MIRRESVRPRNLFVTVVTMVLATTVYVSLPLRSEAEGAETFPVDSPQWQLGPKARISDYRCVSTTLVIVEKERQSQARKQSYKQS